MRRLQHYRSKWQEMLHELHQPIASTTLVADDQAANRELLEELLSAQRCKVIVVPDGAAAVQEVTRTQADLVLLDVVMADLNGINACGKNQEQSGHMLDREWLMGSARLRPVRAPG